MFQRVRESVSNRYYANAHQQAQRAQTARRKRITRRKIKASAQPSQEVQELEQHKDDNINNNVNDNNDNDNTMDNDNDNLSVQSNITIETIRTATNENRKQVADPNEDHRSLSTQVFVEPSQDPTQDPIEVLERAQSDITKLSIYLKQISISKSLANACLALVRGDNRSWEAIAVDILRQKARWDTITMEDVTGEYMDTLMGVLIHLDSTQFLHLSNIILTPHAAWTFQSLGFSKHMTKLQLDLIDLSFAMPLLCKGLHANTSLKCLIASRCGLNDDRLQELFSSLPRQLEELRIFGNKCREKGLAAITAVVHHSQSIKILDMSYQHVDPNHTKDTFDVSWLMGALHHNRTLRVLDLDNDGIDDGHMTHLCAALVVNDTLEEVMLNHNRITAQGIALLSSQFGDMKGLRKISMYSNLFDAPQVDRMVQQQTNPTTTSTNTNSNANANTGQQQQQEQSEPRRPTTVNVPQEDEPSSDIEDDDFLDNDYENEEEYEEETVVEENQNEIGNENDDDKDNEENKDENEDDSLDDDDDDSSAPPPSADFREPSEADNDSIPPRETKLEPDNNNTITTTAATAGVTMDTTTTMKSQQHHEQQQQQQTHQNGLTKHDIIANNDAGNETTMNSSADDNNNDDDEEEDDKDDDVDEDGDKDDVNDSDDEQQHDDEDEEESGRQQLNGDDEEEDSVLGIIVN